MKKFNVVAILDRSAGNETVGEMWKETKVFSDADEIGEIFEWAVKAQGKFKNYPVENFAGNLTITISQ